MPPDSLPLQSRGPSSATLAAKLWRRSRKLAASTFALALATLYTAIRAAHAYRVATFNLPPNLTNPSPNPNHLLLNPAKAATSHLALEPPALLEPTPTPPHHPRLRILHLSDTHFYRGREDLVGWLQWLASRAGQDYDFVAVTGDMLSSFYGDRYLAQAALRPFAQTGMPGAFVLGSHDFYENRPGNPLRYLRRTPGRGAHKAVLDPSFGRYLRAFLADSGWADLNNARTSMQVNGVSLELSGVCDPHIRRDRYVGFGPDFGPVPAGPGTATQSVVAPQSAPKPDGVIRLGLSHAPYSRVLNRFAADGADLVLCGHTHGGQVCLPGGRALVSNCDLPPSQASGVFLWPPVSAGADLARVEDVAGVGDLARVEDVAGVWVEGSCGGVPGRGPWGVSRMFVAVSPGLGTSYFTPLRVFCPPQAYILGLS